MILVVVIFFMGFPLIYAQLSLYLHIPLFILLISIVLRGTTFTFWHYDAIQDSSQRWYSLIFRLSSIIAPLFLGAITGAVILGRIDPDADSFYEDFIAPWFNVFSFSLGLFTCCLFAFLASVYLIGEAETKEVRAFFLNTARSINIATVLAGSLVFLTAAWSCLPLAGMFLRSTPAMLAVVVATLTLPLLWWSLLKVYVLLPRLLLGLETLLIMGDWYWEQYPVIIRYANGGYLGLLESAAPEATRHQLGFADITCTVFSFKNI